MSLSRKKMALAVAAAALTPLFFFGRARGSDHADTPAIAASPGVDLTDVYVFPSPLDPNNVVLVMNVHPLIPTGQAATVDFDPNVLYQFKIDNTGDNVEDLVIQATFQGTGANQKVSIAGPAKPNQTGTSSTLLTPFATTGTLNQMDFTPTAGMHVFAGPREDPFFFDLQQFFNIFPDRATPINGVAVPLAQANTPQQVTFRSAGQAVDFLKGFNVLSIVVELPKTRLGNGVINVWCTTSR